MRIRSAVADDFPRLYELGTRMHGESLISQPPMDEDHTLNIFIDGLRSPNYCCFVAEEDEVVGFIIGFVTPTIFSPRNVGTQDTLYVQPESRTGRAGYMLCREFMRFCVENSAWYIRLSHDSVDPRVGKLFERLGYKKTGEAYTWEPYSRRFNEH